MSVCFGGRSLGSGEFTNVVFESRRLGFTVRIVREISGMRFAHRKRAVCVRSGRR